MKKRSAGFYICITLYIVAHAETKKFPKKRPAHGLLGSAAKWAEMAADHENGQNSKKNFLQLMAIM